jgi:ketosteroid isomerase-like protein
MSRPGPALLLTTALALGSPACDGEAPATPPAVASGAAVTASASPTTSVASPTPTVTDPAGAMRIAERDIAFVLDDWHAAAAKADEERYFSHFSADAVFMGTDATERWDVPAFRAYAHPHFAKGKAWSFQATRRAVKVDGSLRIAWFDEDLKTAGLGPARGSGVMIRGPDGGWRIAHYNLAITVPNERFDEVKSLLARAAPSAGASALPKIKPPDAKPSVSDPLKLKTD